MTLPSSPPAYTEALNKREQKVAGPPPTQTSYHTEHSVGVPLHQQTQLQQQTVINQQPGVCSR
jgi:hypothetical protein